MDYTAGVTRHNDPANRESILKPKFASKSPAANAPDDCESTLDFFRLFYTDTMIEQFVLNTNAYARTTNHKSNGVSWKDVTVSEIWVFFAIVMFMGTISVPQRRLLWDPKTRYFNNFVANNMSMRRFEGILACLHWENTAAFTKEQKAEKKAKDSFWPVATYLDGLATRYKQHFIPGQDMDVDEQCIPAKCYHPAVQYNKDKPAKWAFKNFALNCGKTKYMANFDLYRGKDPLQDTRVPATAYPVLKLVDDTELFQFINLILFLDNWYVSLYLFVALLKLGIHACGTVQTHLQKVF